MTIAAWTLSSLRPYRARVAAIAMLAVLEIGLGALAPWPLKAVVDNVLGGRTLPPLVATVLHPVAGSSVVALLVTIVVAGLLALADVGMVYVGARLFQRETILTKWK